MKLMHAAVVAALATLIAPYASADEPGWYAGANIGQSRSKIDDPRITSSLLGSGFSAVAITDDDRSTGFKVFGGYEFNRNIALEGGYFDLGKFGFTANTLPAGSLNGNIRLRGLNLDLVGTLPITERFSAFGRVGVNYADARDHFSGTGAVRVTDPNPRQRAANVKFGVGLQYAFTDALSVRTEVERYRINDAVGNKGDVDMISVGLVYRFGGPATAAAPRAAMPQPVAQAPAPAPVVMAPAPPPAPAPMRVSFSADSLFDFDKATIKPSGKQSLDKFTSALGATSYDNMTVTGHTDRIGTHAYNLKLSARRADAVKAYLTQAGGIPAAKITATGVDGANPVTKPGDCKGNKPTPALIACLQPDRRVDVEVAGTK
ncbi:MAG: outer membrane beta-barrel protein [Herminiimonas sp.]|nr:outer membrane beta-barrel protein [Herminiimonas sp.]